MGMFSWKCAVSGKDILDSCTAEDLGVPNRCHFFWVTPNKVIEDKAYQSYGRCNEYDMYGWLGNAINGDKDPFADTHAQEARLTGIEGKSPDKDLAIKVVLAENYRHQKYEMLPESKNASNQGWRPSDEAEFEQEYYY